MSNIKRVRMINDDYLPSVMDNNSTNLPLEYVISSRQVHLSAMTFPENTLKLANITHFTFNLFSREDILAFPPIVASMTSL